jgi:hypothetical protein
MKMRFVVEIEASREGGLMTDWSQRMAERVRKKNEYQSVQDAKFLEKQRMMREVGPHLWNAVKSDLRAEGKALNTELGKELIVEGPGSSNEFVIVAKLDSGVREARILFTLEAGKLTYVIVGQGKNDALELSVGQDGKMAFHSSLIARTTGSIAREILESLLDD